MGLALITTKREAEANIRLYNHYLADPSGLSPAARSDLIQLLTHARSWVGVKLDDSFMLGPSKFIGYKEISPESYHRWRNNGLDGRRTDALLRQWGREVRKDHPAFDTLRRLCARHQVTPNAAARVALIEMKEIPALAPEIRQARIATLLTDLVTEIAPTLSQEQRDGLKRRIATL